MLNSDLIQKHLRTAIPVETVEVIDSTNSELKRRVKKGLKGPYLLAANMQTDGRGRQGRSFYSPKNTGVYFSLLVSGAFQIDDAISVTSRAAVAVSEAIESLIGIPGEIKWVNDIYVKGKKVCGILVESEYDSVQQIITGLIIGIGINVSTSLFPSNLTCAGSLPKTVDHNLLISETINNLIEMIHKIKDYSFMEQYRKHCFVLNREIEYEINGKKYCGYASRIDDHCNLYSIENNGTERRLSSGEVRIRLQE